jgi:phospholipid transport system substrate-binding protein
MTSFLRCITLLAISIAPALAEDESPVAVIESAVTLLAEKMDGRSDELASDPDTLYALIDEVLLPRFDRKFAAQLVMAKHWRVADEVQRERFIAAFYQALLRRYADGLLEFNQERV